MLPRFLVLAAAALLTSACGDCVSIGYPAFIVTVRDMRTQQPLVAGTTLVAYGTGGADSVTSPGDSPSTTTDLVLFEGGLDDGWYSVEVRRPGYATWRRDNLRLRDDRCGHPTAPVRLTALLSGS